MRPILIALCAVLACLCCCPAAEAGPVREALRFAAGKARSAATAPFRVVKNRRAARQARHAARGV